MGLRRTVVLLVGAAACHYSEPAGPADAAIPVDAPPMFDDAGHEIRTIIFDSAANWNDVGADMVDVSVDPWGSLTEAGYFYGGMVAHGTQNTLWTPIDDDNKLVWTPTTTANVSGIGLWDGVDIPDGGEVGHFGVGGIAFSVWLEGEVFLAAGANQVKLDANGVAFVEIAPPHTHAYQRVAISRLSGSQTGTFNADAAGYYPIRIGWSKAVNYGLSLQIGVGSPRALKRSDLRTRGDQVRGILRTVFDNQLLGDDHAIPQVDTNNATNTSFNAPPPGAPSDNLSWSARYAGQFYVAQAGSYNFHADTDDGNVLMVAGQSATPNHWGYNSGTGGARSDVRVDLQPGWTDLALDYNQVGSVRRVQLSITDGPELAGQNLPIARLRPVEPRTDRITANADKGSHTIQDNSTGNPGVATATTDGLANETITRVDVLVHVNTPRLDNLVFDLKNTSGVKQTLQNHGGGSAAGDQWLFFSLSGAQYQAFLTTAVAGTWTMTVTDNVNGGGGSSTLLGFFVTVHTTGGNDQIAPSGTWIWTGDLTTSLFRVDDIRWTERVPEGATPAEIRMRTCAMEGCADNPPWSGPIAQHVATNLESLRYLQIKVVMTSDGTRDTELQSLIIDYRRNL
jgi:subtilisin-like proprotein convertase family protein